MAAEGSPVVARHRLRLALRRKREATGRTQGDVAKSLDWSLSKLQRIEAGENSISITDLQALLGQLKVTDRDYINTLVAEARIARSRSRWEDRRYRDNLTPATKMLLDFEAAAIRIRSFQTVTIPGVLQTPEFATEVFRAWGAELSDLEREIRFEVRIQRREHVLDRPNPPVYELILDESLLHRAIGGSRTYAEQLRHILTEAREGRIDLRVAPFPVPSRVGAHIPFTILTLDTDLDSLLYRENYQSDEIVQDLALVERHIAFFDQLWQQSYSENETGRIVEAQISSLLSQSDPQTT